MRFILPAIILAMAIESRAADPELTRIQNEIASADGCGGYYDSTYRKMESTYWHKIRDWMKEDATHRKAARILDIGCGYGTLLSLATKMYGAQGYCIDVFDYLKPTVASAHNLVFIRGNVELVPIPWPDKFDVVIMTEVLEHFNFQPLPTLRKIHDAVAANGTLFLSTPDARDWGRVFKFYRRLSDLPMPDPSLPVRDAHIWIYNKKELTTLLDQAGFEIKQLGYAKGNGNRHFNVQAVPR